MSVIVSKKCKKCVEDFAPVCDYTLLYKNFKTHVDYFSYIIFKIKFNYSMKP